jgi:hypothetical protein
MLRPALAFLVFAAATAVPASAAIYSAKLTSPASGRFIARDIVWNCGPEACEGATDESRPAVLCQSLAKRAGHIDSFIVDGRGFTAAELDRCNASAKADNQKALAAQ